MSSLQFLNSGDSIFHLWLTANTTHKERLSALVLEKKFTMKDTETPYRVINHWCEKGLVEDQRADASQKWRKLSLTDLVWLNVVSDLRTFGMPLDKIRIAKKMLFEEDKKHLFSMFHIWLLEAMQKKAVQILIYSDGTAGVSSGSEIQSIIKMDDYRSHICISMNNILERMYKKGHVVGLDKQPIFVNDFEKRVISVLNNPDVREVSILLNGKNVKSFQVGKEVDVRREILDVLAEKDYQEVRVKRHAGKDVCFTRYEFLPVD